MANSINRIAESTSQIMANVEMAEYMSGRADNIYNFCKIKGNAFIQKQIEHRHGRVFMRSKKRNLILVRQKRESRVFVNNINHETFDGMYHL